MLDERCRELIDRDPNLLVPWYLMCSFLYYHEDEAIISDGLYDEICQRLDREWRKVDHPHKRLVKRKDLKAGTGFTLKRRDLPMRTVSAALLLLEEMRHFEETCG